MIKGSNQTRIESYRPFTQWITDPCSIPTNDLNINCLEKNVHYTAQLKVMLIRLIDL